MLNHCKDIKEEYDALKIQTAEFVRVFEEEKASGVFVRTRKLRYALREAKENLEEKIGFEKKALDFLESLRPALTQNDFAERLCGFTSKRVQKIRQNLLESGVPMIYILYGLAGDDSKEAWEIRDSIPENKIDGTYFMSLIGIDSPRSMEIRRQGIERGKDLEFIILSLAGLDSKPAKEMRNELKDEVDKFCYLLSLRGIQSDESIEDRRGYFGKVDLYNIINSLIGTDPSNIDVEEFRIECLNQDTHAWETLLTSLAGIDSKYAWEQRDSAMKEPVLNAIIIASSLAGLNTPRAWAMRKELQKHGASAKILASSLAGSNLYFLGWYLKGRNKKAA